MKENRKGREYGEGYREKYNEKYGGVETSANIECCDRIILHLLHSFHVNIRAREQPIPWL